MSTTAENMPLDALDLNPEGSGDPKANPILMLDQEQINRLENVLSSDEAKSFLGEVLANPDNNPNQSLGDILTSTGQTNVSNLTTNPEFALIGPPPPLIPNSEMLDNSLTSSLTSNNNLQPGPSNDSSGTHLIRFKNLNSFCTGIYQNFS